MKAYLVTKDEHLGFTFERVIMDEDTANKYAELKNTEINNGEFCSYSVEEIELKSTREDADLSEMGYRVYVYGIPYIRASLGKNFRDNGFNTEIKVCQGNTLDNSEHDFVEQDIAIDDKNRFHINIKRPLKGVYDEEIMVAIYSDVLNDLSKKFDEMVNVEKLNEEEIRKWFYNKDNIDNVIKHQQEGRYEYKSHNEHMKEQFSNIKKAYKMKKEAQVLIDQAKEAGMFTKTESED
ncbi:hypothetical protein [Priestia megaterium]|uniref:hypothetical protein n=1 Tax=Priestia megaterium TaxID=1404 RepID=UPI0011297E97|nr:hypothetical protein [Priestia megaterium]TPF18089.1 hypothetical protein CBE78_02345 [Priestia megaterium]TPF22196.1 hypothetical protein CBE79_04850 [Priestia megaterium]